MTMLEAREEIPNPEYLKKIICDRCIVNEDFCPSECDTLRRVDKIFDRAVGAYAKYDGDLYKTVRYINNAKVGVD